jgi:SAM-dependent methyltransferase
MQQESITFHHPDHENDLSMVESVIYPLFTQQNEKNKQYWNKIRSLFLTAMKNANLNLLKRHMFWLYVNRTITKGLKNGKPLIEIEETLRSFLRARVDDEEDKKTLAISRVQRSFALVKDYIIGEKILDLGAGDGLLALEIQKKLKKEVLLVDIVDYNYTDLPLILYDPKERIPIGDGEVDTTILYTVLHHASDPRHVLGEAARITKDRLVIIEGYAEEENILMTNSFFDWFYNRVIGDEDIVVPLNFLKVSGWETLLRSHGFEIVETTYLGINEPIVPEHQILIIADRTDK